MQLCSKKLYAFGGQKLKVVGQFKSELAVEETKIHALLWSNEGGAWTATELGILHVGT